MLRNKTAKWLLWPFRRCKSAQESMGSALIADLGCLRSFCVLHRVVLNRLAFRQRAETIHLNFAVMDKQIFAALVRRNEAEPLLIVEPLDLPRRHTGSLLTTPYPLPLANKRPHWPISPELAKKHSMLFNLENRFSAFHPNICSPWYQN